MSIKDTDDDNKENNQPLNIPVHDDNKIEEVMNTSPNDTHEVEQSADISADNDTHEVEQSATDPVE
jgi:hypothetical protein